MGLLLLQPPQPMVRRLLLRRLPHPKAASRRSRRPPRPTSLQLRPRRLRDASTLWGSLRTRQGTEARDGVWMHPDLLPTAADLDDPLGFREGASAPEALSEEDFDAELRRLLDGPTEE